MYECAIGWSSTRKHKKHLASGFQHRASETPACKQLGITSCHALPLSTSATRAQHLLALSELKTIFPLGPCHAKNSLRTCFSPVHIQSTWHTKIQNLFLNKEEKHIENVERG
jgi:hypothetical protein